MGQPKSLLHRCSVLKIYNRWNSYFQHKCCLSRMGTNSYYNRGTEAQRQELTAVYFVNYPEPRVLTNSRWSTHHLYKTNVGGKKNQPITYSHPLTIWYCVYLQAPAVHHTWSPLSSCHLALCLLYEEAGRAPHLLTTRPDSKDPASNQRASTDAFRCFYILPLKKNSLHEVLGTVWCSEWRWMLDGRMLITAQRGTITSSGLFLDFLTLLIFWDFPNKVAFHKQYGMGKGSTKISQTRRWNDS